MKYAYTLGRSTPALMVPVKIGTRNGRRRIDLIGVIDTGADLSVIPARVVADLKMNPVGSRSVGAAFGEPFRERLSYYVDVEVLGCGRYEVEAVTQQDDELLLGRDVLNQLVLHADGPAGFFQVIP